MGRSEELFERAVERIPGGVNSPVRAYGAIGKAPRFIDKADGCYIYDVDGNKYIDYIDSWGPMILGHNFPEIREAVVKACEKAPKRRYKALLQMRFINGLSPAKIAEACDKDERSIRRSINHAIDELDI